ncbi:uncharacterized protein LOC144702728 isoform X2 [Wolffia australiana]
MESLGDGKNEDFRVQMDCRNISVQSTAQVSTPTAPFQERRLASSIWRIIFIIHVIISVVLAAFLSLRGLLNRAAISLLPPLSAAAFSAAFSAAFLLAALRRPSAAIRAAFSLAPLLSLSLSFLLLAAGGAAASAVIPAAALVLLSLVLSLYACWAAPRLPPAAAALAAATPPTLPAAVAAASLAAALLCAATWTLAATATWTLAPLLLSFAWTMSVVRNALAVAAARSAYTWLAAGEKVHVAGIWRAAWTVWLGDVALGSVLVPVVVGLRGSARGLSLLAGSADEFLFSCVDCSVGLSGRLIGLANRWGLAMVGAHGKGFLAASADTWRLFLTRGMVPLVDEDLTSSFCFFAGVAGGAAAGLVAAAWAAAAGRDDVAALAVRSFVAGAASAWRGRRAACARYTWRTRRSRAATGRSRGSTSG